MAINQKRVNMTVCVLRWNDFQCEDCGHELCEGDSFVYDPRTESKTCSVMCAESIRAHDFRPAFAA